MTEFGFIGAGNMGGALATAVSKSTKSVLIADFFADKAAQLADKLGVKPADNETIAKDCKYIYLGSIKDKRGRRARYNGGGTLDRYNQKNGGR